METVVAPNINVVRRGILIRYVTKLGSRSSGILEGRNLSWSSTLLVLTTRVVGIPQMVFTNLITNSHGNMTLDRPLMSSMVVRRCKSANVVHSKGGYWKLIPIITPILDHRDGHYIRPNMVVLKYPDLKKDVDTNAHVKMFKFHHIMLFLFLQRKGSKIYFYIINKIK